MRYTFFIIFILIQSFQIYSFELFPPVIYFENNSLNYDSEAIFEFGKNNYLDSSDASIDSIFNYMFKALKKHPTLVFTVSGHSSFDEKDPNNLSKKRAQKVCDVLIELGINSKRLIVKANGDRMLRILKNEVNTCPEINCTSAKNRRVVFNVIRADFKE